MFLYIDTLRRCFAQNGEVEKAGVSANDRYTQVNAAKFKRGGERLDYTDK